MRTQIASPEALGKRVPTRYPRLLVPGFKFRKPYRVQWSDLGPPRLELNSAAMKGGAKTGSLVDRVTRIFLAMDDETKDRVLEKFREQHGDGSYAYAKRTIASWKHREVQQIGLTVIHLLDVVPLFVDLPTKFELARILREETLKRARQVKVALVISDHLEIQAAAEQLRMIIDTQLNATLPPGVVETGVWLSREYGGFFEQMIREAEKRLLYAQAQDYMNTAEKLLKMRGHISPSVQINAVFELPTALFTLRIVQPRRRGMHEQSLNDDSGLLAKWNDLELETRFKSGEVSYPEYVLRNMDQFFTKEEQSELHKIAAMHGLELERLLMEIQIKSRTSDADLQKLLTTLRTLQEKKIAADVVSRHETPSGHIEISAKSRRGMGCLPMSVFVITALILLLR